MELPIAPSTVLAVIPARGGSKGIPRKNLLRVGGRTLVARTVEQARLASRVGRVVVSTDDDEIAAAGSAAGAEIVKRPPALSGDSASSESAVLHVLAELERTEGWRPQLVVLLQCTSPLTIAEDIDGTIAALERDHADAALAVAACHHFLWAVGPDGAAVGVNHDATVRQRRQERTPEFVETGAVYVMRASGFVSAGHRFFGKIAMHETPRRRWLELDEADDVTLAAALAARRDDAHAALPARIGALVLDFDGVFTDNRVIVGDDGHESVVCDRADGLGLAELRRAGLPTVVLSSEKNPVVTARCAKLGLDARQGLDDKLGALRAWAGERGIDLADIVFVGNDRNDVACLAAVGCGVAVADAHPSAIAAARIVLTHAGGHGAIREVTDLLLRQLGKEP